MNRDPERNSSLQATWSATFVDELARAGVTHAFVCPGSRSTAIALALAADDRMSVHVHHDERSAAFMALGAGRATGLPAAVLTTSGTAAVECHPAVVEADLDAVALLVVTADRPRRLRAVAAPQTIIQPGLFGSSVRAMVEIDPTSAPPPDPDWRSVASRAVLAATASPPGPVHINVELDEPWSGLPGALPAGRPDGMPWHRRAGAPEVPMAGVGDLGGVDLGGIERGVIVAGGARVSPDDVVALATVTGWPVLADPRSGARVPSPAVVTAFDCILRCDAFADRMLPDLVVQIGSPPASRVLSEWVARAADSGAHHVVIDPHGRWLDPGRRAAHVWGGDPNRICRQLATGRHPREVDGRWIESWQRAEATAVAVVERVLATEKPTSEPAVARALVEGLPDGAHLVVSSSMPVRDVEWYSPARGGLRVHANRGANGIDGVVSTAVGVALASGAPTAALVGDLAYLHDLGALVGATGRNADLTVVVVDNDGGGIFSFLPQASELDPARFEQLFGTPHGLDLAAVTAALGVAVVAVEATDDVAGLGRRVAGGGIGVAVVTTDRKANVDVHDRLQREVRSSLEAAGLL